MPDLVASSGIRAGSSSVPRRGSAITPPSYSRCTSGSTPRPDSSGLVSRCASSPITGAPATVPGSVAVTKPFASIAASASPIGEQLVDEQAPQLELPGGARRLLVRAVGLGVDPDVAQEPVEHVGGELLGQRRGVRGERRHRRHHGCMPTIWTIGYERLLPPALLAELQAAAVERVIDVRFRPQSRRPGMSKTRLGEMLGDHGIAYEHRKALGTPPDLRHDFHAGRVERAAAAYRVHVEATAPEALDAARRRAGATARAPRCCASRPTRRAATGACSRRRSPSACPRLRVVDL